MVINTDPSTQQQTIVIVCIVSPVVSSLFVAIRIWTRTLVTHSVGWDDCKLATPPVFNDLALTLYRSCSNYSGNYVLMPALTLCIPHSLWSN